MIMVNVLSWGGVLGGFSLDRHTTQPITYGNRAKPAPAAMPLVERLQRIDWEPNSPSAPEKSELYLSFSKKYAKLEIDAGSDSKAEGKIRQRKCP